MRQPKVPGRRHVHAHRGLTPSLLPLIVYRHNLRAFPRGMHRGEAPFVALGILPAENCSWIERLLRPTPPAGEAEPWLRRLRCR